MSSPEVVYKYRCTHNGCPKGYNSKMNLIIHERKHTGQKPFECQICHKTFPSNGNLKKHLGIHKEHLKKREAKEIIKNAIVNKIVT